MHENDIHVIEDERGRPEIVPNIRPIKQEENEVVRKHVECKNKQNGDMRLQQSPNEHECEENNEDNSDTHCERVTENESSRKRVNFSDCVCYSSVLASNTFADFITPDVSLESTDPSESTFPKSVGNADSEVPTSYDARSRLSGPQFTISMKRKNTVYQQETANVYGNIEPDSQVVAIAQNFYKETTHTSDIVGIDDIDIIDFQKEKRRHFTRQDAIARPTSMLYNIQESIEENNVPHQAAFLHRKIDKSGGTLEILGVKLVIPEGAVENEVQMTLGITWDSSLYPNLSKTLTMLSPVVVCQPSITFLKPVQLSFPHSAVCHQDNWKLSVYCRDNDLQQTNSEWRELTNGDYSNIAISDHQVTIQLKHFTLYTLVGEGIRGKMAIKAVKILAFASPFQVNKMYSVRIYCINNYENDSSEMKVT